MNPALRGATGWLVVVNLALAAALVGLWLAPGGSPAQWRNWQAPVPQPPTLQDVHATVLASNPAASAAYPGVLARPLMNATRRPMAAPAPQTPASASPPAAIEQVKLLGVVAGPTLNGVMIERDGQTSFVRRGESVGDWTLDSLQGRAASFVRNGERRQIELPFAHGVVDAAALKGHSAVAPQTPARAAVAVPSATGPAPAPRPVSRATVSEADPAPASVSQAAPAASTAKPGGPVAAFGGSGPRSPASAPQ